jgi:hypothetical protein
VAAISAVADLGRRQNHSAVGRRNFAAEFFLQILETQSLRPKLFGLVEVLGIGRVAPVEQNVFVGVEFEFVLLQQFVHIVGVLLNSFQVSPVNFISGREVGGAVGADGEGVEIRPVAREFGNVGLQEIFVPRIQRFQITVKKLPGNVRVEQLLRVMKFLQQPRRDVGDARVVRPRPTRARLVDVAPVAPNRGVEQPGSSSGS